MQPEAFGPRVHEAGIHRPQVVLREPETFPRAGHRVLDDDISGAHEFEQPASVLLAAQIEGHRPLRSVPVDVDVREDRQELVTALTAGRLHLDDVGAQLRQ